MADITNPQAIKFANEQIRVLASMLLKAVRAAQDVREAYYAHSELGDLFYAGIADALIDGSQADGRPIITGNDIMGIITRADELNADYSANNNAKLNTLLRVAMDEDVRP